MIKQNISAKENNKSPIGSRIRNIRKAKGLSQVELGEIIDLVPNRIQQYENGARTPKLDMIKKIAEGLDVDTDALLNPQISTYTGVMRFLFELETIYGLKINKINEQICIGFNQDSFDANTIALNKYLELWEKRRTQFEKDMLEANSEEEKQEIVYKYNEWEWNFPKSTLSEKEV